jgi:hypothetical protein
VPARRPAWRLVHGGLGDRGMRETSEEPSPRARLWIGIIAGLMRAAARDLGPDCPVGRRFAEGAEDAVALMAAQRPRLTLVKSDTRPLAPPGPALARPSPSARRARRRTTSPG